MTRNQLIQEINRLAVLGAAFAVAVVSLTILPAWLIPVPIAIALYKGYRHTQLIQTIRGEGISDA